MMAFINVRMIMPALISGIDARRCDRPLHLRPTEIRGMLRFWTRALAAGAGLHHRQEESILFGSIGQKPNESYGAMVRILPVDISQTHQIQCHPLFPHKDGAKQAIMEMIEPNSSYIRLKFLLHPAIELDKFRAVLWTWLHLGAAGKRGRRGYGSLVWMPTHGDIFEGFISCDAEADLAGQLKIEAYIKKGLDDVERVWGTPKPKKDRDCTKFFQLCTIDQIFVGQPLKDNKGNLLNRLGYGKQSLQTMIHGLDFENRKKDDSGNEIGTKNEHKEMGFSKGKHDRLASPIIWRLLPCGNGLVPIMTWSSRYVKKLTPGTKMHKYLTHTLGFDKSLMGNPL